MLFHPRTLDMLEQQPGADTHNGWKPMFKLVIAAALGAATLSAPALAQDSATAPDGTRAFGISPYFGVGGGYQDFDSKQNGAEFNRFGSARAPSVDAFVGVDVPLGPLVVGVEAQGAKGFQDIDWEYGAMGRVGVRAGESGLIFARAGYRWIEGRRGYGNDHNEVYGVGVEIGPKNIGLGGLTGNSGVRLRLAADTYDLRSIRPSAALVFHF